MKRKKRLKSKKELLVASNQPSKTERATGTRGQETATHTKVLNPAYQNRESVWERFGGAFAGGGANWVEAREGGPEGGLAPVRRGLKEASAESETNQGGQGWRTRTNDRCKSVGLKNTWRAGRGGGDSISQTKRGERSNSVTPKCG